MWGWLDGVVSGLKTVWETLLDLPQLIWGYFEDAFSEVTSWLWDIYTVVDDLFSQMVGWIGDIVRSIEMLPDYIMEGLKSIFVPDTESIESSFSSFRDELKMKFNFDTEFFDTLFDDERPVTDITTDYTISGVGTFNLKLFDTKYLYEGVTYFRPFIRGFLVFLMALYNIRMVLSFIRQDAGVVAGKGSDIESGKKGGRHE